MRNVAKHTETTTVDKETGEVTKSVDTKQYKTASEPNYIKLYIQDISYLNELPAGTDRIIYAMLPYINYQQEIYINSHNKKKMAEEVGVSDKHISNTIVKLVKKEILIRVDRGVYQLNTYIFGKGPWKDILKHRSSLKLEVFYDWKHGRTIKLQGKDND